MELLQLNVDVLKFIFLFVGIPYCLYNWFNAAVAMFRLHRSFKPEVSFWRRWAVYSFFNDEGVAELFTEEGLAHRRDSLKYLFRFLVPIFVMMALAFLAEAIQSPQGTSRRASLTSVINPRPLHPLPNYQSNATKGIFQTFTLAYTIKER